MRQKHLKPFIYQIICIKNSYRNETCLLTITYSSINCSICSISIIINSSYLKPYIRENK